MDAAAAINGHYARLEALLQRPVGAIQGAYISIMAHKLRVRDVRPWALGLERSCFRRGTR